MEPGGLLLCLHESGIVTHPEPVASISPFHTPFLEDPFFLNIILPTLGLPGFLTKILYIFLIYPMHATYPICFILLDAVALTILGDEYKLLSSSVHISQTVPPSLTCPNILPSTLFLDTHSIYVLPLH